jgi:hypothetical protein
MLFPIHDFYALALALALPPSCNWDMLHFQLLEKALAALAKTSNVERIRAPSRKSTALFGLVFRCASAILCASVAVRVNLHFRLDHRHARHKENRLFHLGFVSDELVLLCDRFNFGDSAEESGLSL